MVFFGGVGCAWFFWGGVCGFFWGVCSFFQGGVHGFFGGVCGFLGGCAWFFQGACMVVEGCVWLPGGTCIGYNEIRSMSGRYASCWNAFLFELVSNFFLILTQYFKNLI